MASGSDDSPPHHQDKRSKKNNDPTGSFKPSGRTKVACPCDAASARGRGRGAHARGAQASTQAPADPPPYVGAIAWDRVPGIGRILATNMTEEALDQEGRTIDPEVCPRTPPRGIIQFGESHLVPFQGNIPTI